MKNGLNIFLTKIRFTYEAIPETFKEIGNGIKGNIGKIFIKASQKMQETSAGKAWEEALDNQNTNLTKVDIDILKKLGRMLGKTDIEGQISEIKLVDNFIDTQIKEAEIEKKRTKNYIKH